MITRRKCITLLGGAAAAWPVAARAQQPAIPAVGFLFSESADPVADRMRAFRQGLREVGFVEGENLTVVYRFAEGQNSRLPELAAELVRRRVDVIATFGGATLAAKQVTTTIPIVFGLGDDPVRLGLVSSLARPNGNMTGISFLNSEVVAKRMELLRELLPGLARVAVLLNPAFAGNADATLRDVEAAAAALGLEIDTVNASASREINAAFARFARNKPEALLVSGDPFFNARRVQLVHLASRYAIPATFPNRDFVHAGGLMSYGANIGDAWRQVGVYAGRVLKGAKPADLPVERASKFELAINAETARLLGLELPPTLLARADEVIE
jgi:putative ABC transport system substrate-binding protein